MVIKAKPRIINVEAILFLDGNVWEIKEFVGVHRFYIGPRENIEVYVDGNRWSPVVFGDYIIKDQSNILQIMTTMEFQRNYETLEGNDVGLTTGN